MSPPSASLHSPPFQRGTCPPPRLHRRAASAGAGWRARRPRPAIRSLEAAAARGGVVGKDRGGATSCHLLGILCRHRDNPKRFRRWAVAGQHLRLMRRAACVGVRPPPECSPGAFVPVCEGRRGGLLPCTRRGLARPPLNCLPLLAPPPCPLSEQRVEGVFSGLGDTRPNRAGRRANT